ENKLYEIIIVNDGSSDGSQRVTKELCDKDDSVKGIELRKNFGQTAALGAGIEIAKGKIIVTMDADLQNDPEDIPRMIAKLEEGYDVISGWRKSRKDKMITRRIPSIIANYIVAKITKVKLHDYGCALKVYRRSVLDGMKLYGDMHRFLPIYVSINGARIGELEVNHRPRIFGSSKYGLSRILKVVLDLASMYFFLNFMTKPMRMFGTIGIMFSVLGGAILSYLTVLKFVFGESIGSRPLLLVSVLFIIMGIQFAGFGLLAELLSRIYHESSDKSRSYAVRTTLNLENKS
ncbi:MAG: glycosyltransferase family 2 protein, partial [bacterium]|nr:glycosyltransferase family 2 protein [bacterium]